MLKGVNWLGVTAATVVAQLLSWVWYGMLFAEKLSGTMSPRATTPVGYAEAFALDLIMLTGLAWVVARTGAKGVQGAVQTAVAVWFFFPMVYEWYLWLYTGEALSMVAINAGYALVHLGVAGALIGGLKPAMSLKPKS